MGEYLSKQQGRLSANLLDSLRCSWICRRVGYLQAPLTHSKQQDVSSRTAHWRDVRPCGREDVCREALLKGYRVVSCECCDKLWHVKTLPLEHIGTHHDRHFGLAMRILGGWGLPPTALEIWSIDVAFCWAVIRAVSRPLLPASASGWNSAWKT